MSIEVIYAQCECRFRHGRSLHPARPVVRLLRAHGISIRLDAVIHCQSHAESSLLWICLALRSRAFWCGARFGFGVQGSLLGSRSSIRPIFRDWSYHSCSACICMLTIHSFTAHVSLRMLLIWLPESWTSSTT